MLTWNLTAHDPLCLTLAADARLCQPDYSNDHIWELSLGQGEPVALTLWTTFGLRVNELRLFPRFTSRATTVSNPSLFHQSPLITKFYPNYLALTCEPFENIAVKLEYRVVTSHIITGRINFVNQTGQAEKLHLEWCAVLEAGPASTGMGSLRLGANHILQGQAGNLSVACFLTGGPQAENSPYPALALDIDLEPAVLRQFNWTLVADPDTQQALNLARLVTARPWEAEVARIERQNAHQTIEIQTGDPDWDAAFAFAQKVAVNCIMSGSGFKHPSFVLSRRPDQGYSNRGDGKDYPPAWNGQTALDAWYLASILLPGGYGLAQGFLHNFIETQLENGFIDSKPGLAGQRSQRLAQPILASLALRIHQHHPDLAWLREIYSPLLRFAQCWFDPNNDRDQDGFPEWDHPLQTGLEDLPLYDDWHPASDGVDIRMLESPALAAMLYRECTSLAKIARLTDQAEQHPWLEEQGLRLKSHVFSTWNPATGSYHYRDALTHLCQSGQRLLEVSGNGEYPVKIQWELPHRLTIHFESSNEYTRYNRVMISGMTPQGPGVETIEPRQFHWRHRHTCCTIAHAFLSVDNIEIHGMQESDQCWLESPDYAQEDISLLLPLWAGIPDPETASRMISQTIPNRYLRAYGIPLTPNPGQPDAAESLVCCQALWNQLIGEGLLAYGYRDQAADLVTRSMNGLLPSLKQSHAFREYYHASSGTGMGDTHNLRGLPPLGLFLQVLGVERLSKSELILASGNPFPWPVSLRYQGITIDIQTHETSVVFPNGQRTTLQGPGMHRISLG